MIKLIHARSGGEMWVHESRLEEYLAAGHRIAGAPRPPAPVKKTATKKSTSKK